MLDLTKPVQTRDGRKVRIICSDRKCSKSPDEPIIALVESSSARHETLLAYELNGRIGGAEYGEHPADLINVPETLTTWHVSGVRGDGTPFCFGCHTEGYAQQKAADARKNGGRVLITKVEGIPT